MVSTKTPLPSPKSSTGPTYRVRTLRSTSWALRLSLRPTLLDPYVLADVEVAPVAAGGFQLVYDEGRKLSQVRASRFDGPTLDRLLDRLQTLRFRR